MEYIKKHWKEILIIVLTILFVSKCTGKGNYERKYKAQVARIEYVTDSLNRVYKNTSSENVATETPADTASATTETVEAPADSAVAQ